MAPTPGGKIRSHLEEIRFRGERGVVGLMRARDTGLVRPPYDHLLPPELLWRRRRELLASGLRISKNLAPDVHERIEQARTLLGVDLPVEAYQFASSSPEVVNAGFWGHGDAVILSFDGQLLGRFDDAGLLFFLGHELGHHLAHGAPPSWLDRTGKIYQPLFSPNELKLLLSRAHELTADRFGLLVCRDLDAMLRASVVLATNLPAAVRWEPRAYLDQCRAHVDALRARGEEARGASHPEHSLRAYAAWLFSESDLYRELTGLGSGRLRIEVIDRDLTSLLGLPPALSLPSSPLDPPASPPSPGPPAPSPAPGRPLVTSPAPGRPPVTSSTPGLPPATSSAPGRPPASSPAPVRPSAPPGPAPAEPSATPRPSPSPGLSAASPRAPLPQTRERLDRDALVTWGQASLSRVARAAVGRSGPPVRRPDGSLDEIDVVDPLLDDERELLARFEALERKERAKV